MDRMLTKLHEATFTEDDEEIMKNVAGVSYAGKL